MTTEVLKCHTKIDPPAPAICEPICPKVNVENGTYGSVTIVDGCIVDAQDCHLPIYTPAICCGGSGGGGGGGGTTTITDIALLPDACNLLRKVGSEYYVKPVVANSSSVTWSGCGTPADPYTLAVVATNDDVVITGVDCIQTSFNGTSWVIAHTDNGLNAGTYDGITVNQCGHITNVELEATQELEPLGGTSVVIDGNDISLQSSPAAGVYDLGNTSLTIDNEGRVIAIVTTPIVAGTFTTADGKTVTYDSAGVITSVV